MSSGSTPGRRPRPVGLWRLISGSVALLALLVGYPVFGAVVADNPALESLTSFGQKGSTPSFALSSSLVSTLDTPEGPAPQVTAALNTDVRMWDGKPFVDESPVSDFAGVTLPELREYAGPNFVFNEQPSGMWTQPVILAHPDVAAALERAGIAANNGSAWTFDVRRYMAAVDEGLSWEQIPANASGSGKVLLTTSSFVAESDASLAFLSIIMNLVSGERGEDERGDPSRETAERIGSYFLPEDARPGAAYGVTTYEVSPAMTAYLTQGESQVPFALSTEAEYLNVARNPRLGTIPQGTVVMALTPSRLLEAQFGRFARLDTDMSAFTADGMPEDLQELVANKGWRGPNTVFFERTAATAGFTPLERPRELVPPVDSTQLAFARRWTQ